MSFSRKLVLMALTILLPALLSAGITGKLTGKVTDQATGLPLAGANVIVEGQRVVPAKLLDHGFDFKFPELEGALRAILKG